MARSKTTFKPGAKPGPGRPETSQEAKEGRKLTKALFQEIVHNFTGLSRDELIAIIRNPKTKVLELIVAKIMSEAMVKGDQVRMNFLLDRLVGKVKEEVEHSGPDGAPLTFVVKRYIDD